MYLKNKILLLINFKPRLIRHFLIATFKSIAFLIIFLIILEFIYRLYIGASIKAIDFRSAKLLLSDQTSISMYEEEVGWITKSGHKSNGFNTKEFGLRALGSNDEKVPIGGVLVVGNSFAAGSEVNDEFTWPAILEKIIQKPVLNAAVGGYGLDQSVLRARQLLNILKPKTILVSLQLDSLSGVDFTSYGRPKPYFIVENGNLKRMNKPVPFLSGPSNTGRSEKLRSYLAYSAVVDRFLSIFATKWWYESAHSNFQRLNQDFVDVACRILEPFKIELDAVDVRLLVVIQYHGSLVDPSKGRYRDLDKVRRCINEKGIQTADEWDSLLAVAKKGPDELKKYYVMQPDNVTFGHMSALGNKLVAEVVAVELSKVH